MQATGRSGALAVLRSSASGNDCEDHHKSGFLPAWSGGVRVRYQDSWLGAEACRQQGDGFRMTIYGINVGSTY